MPPYKQRIEIALNLKVGASIKVPEIGTRRLLKSETVGNGRQVRLTLSRLGSESRDTVITVPIGKRMELGVVGAATP